MTHARVVVASALVLALLVSPDAALASSKLPPAFEITTHEDGRNFLFTVTESGYDFVDTGDFGSYGSVDHGAIAGMDIQVISSDAANLAAVINVPDALGGTHSYNFTGTLDAARDSISGSFVTESGKVSAPVTVTIDRLGGYASPGDTGIQVAAVVILLCIIIQIATDCGEECVEACGAGNVLSYKEKTCGRCSCRCQ